MPTFTLNMAFTAEDLARFYATGTNIVIAKPSSTGSTPNVAWIVYRPLIANQVTWEEQYGIYVSNVDIINGAQLTQMSASPFPAIDGKVYTMTPAGNITGPTDGGTPNAYTLVNKYDNLPKGYLTVGLYQNATVDGRATNGNAVSAAQVLYNSTATMTPYSTVYLWTQSQVKSNTVVTNVTSVMTQVNLGGSITTASLRYDASTGKFVETGKALSLPSGGPLLEHILPKLAA